MSSSRGTAEVGSAANSYEILAKLAMGGMAEIFLARGASSAGVERYVVLKRVLREKSTDAHFIRMFLDEARLAAQLQHPNIAQVYDIGKLGDSFFFTMEYVHGETVRTLLHRSHSLRRPIPINVVLTVIAGSAAGLHHAHERKGIDGKHLGIVHRDVSPSNLMISYEGTVKVVDFGVAKASHRDTETRSGTVKGKITYMSPEQCKGAEIDRRSDLFSLGIVMWELLTTERLFRRNSDFENMQAIVAEDVPPPSSMRPDIPPEIDRIVMKLLAKRAEDRYQNADELHEAIEEAAVRTGSALSAASLGRFVRELFGQRPEPWIELTSHEQHPEVFTVTSEPIPMELALSPADVLDARLAAIPQLSQQITAQETPPHVPAVRAPLPTVPLRVQAEDLGMAMPHRDSHPGPMPPQQAIRAQSQAGMVPPGHPTLPMVVAPMSSPASGMHAMRPHTPSLTPGSNPQYPVLQSSSPSHSMLSYQQHRPAQGKRSRAVVILIPATVVGIIIGIALALGGDKKKPVASTGEAPTTVALTAGDPVAKEPAPAPPLPVAPPPQPVATPPQPVAALTPGPSDVGSAAPPVAKDLGKDPPKADPPKKDPPPKAEPKEDIATLFKAGKLADVVATCNTSTRLVAANATACTVSACRTKETSKARRWFGSVAAAKRSSVAKDCAGYVTLETPRVDDPCKRDPLACQH